jgi:hypothetical protein
MSEQVHYIPVGFDFERLIYPISKGEMKADRVVLITHDAEFSENSASQAAELGSNMTSQLSRAFDLIDVEVEKKNIDYDTMYNYDEAYSYAHQQILSELKNGNEVFVNISSMPRTVAFAFATASDSLITEFQEDLEEIRDLLHTYYVPPERYLVLDMIETLEEVGDFLNSRRSEDLEVENKYRQVQSILDKVSESGITEGARDLGGQMYVEFPASPRGDVEDFEEKILRFLYSDGNGVMASTSGLAKELAKHLEIEYDQSFRSKVQYNVSNLDEKGYISRQKSGNRLETELSTVGKMWVETHQ